MPHLIDHIATDIGRLSLVVDPQGHLCAAGFTEEHKRMAKHLKRLEKVDGALVSATNPSGISDRMRAYFAGELTVIDDLQVAPLGTEFQLDVWRALRQIPCGQTWTYGQLATFIHRPKAVRAVGLANGANPISIVVPCHRVIGANGTLTGYGGGLHRKKWLLAHEQPTAQIALPF